MVLILETCPSAHLLVVGTGNLERELKQQAIREGIDAAVNFAGYRSDIPQILSAADLFVLPSLAEGLPLAALEAMAACLPVVATDVGGTAEAVVDGETGLLVPPANPHRLAAAILSLVSDRERRVQMGSAGRARVEQRFSARVAAKTLGMLYLQLLGSEDVIAT
jgi:glycosyltransferase involved in cell wall biosynthesis